MKQSHFEKLDRHYMKYFQVKNPDKEVTVIHPIADDGHHVDVIICKANKKRPFQILATMGASDHAMRGNFGSLTNRNEYVTFAPADWDFSDEKYSWLVDWLFVAAKYARVTGDAVSYIHTLDMSQVIDAKPSEDFNMTAVQMLFPQAIEDTGVLRAKLGLFRTATILHMMPITEEELHLVREKGDLEALADKFYNDKPGNLDFLAALKR